LIVESPLAQTMPGNFRTEAEKIVDARSRGERRVVLPDHTRGLFWPENSLAGPSAFA